MNLFNRKPNNKKLHTPTGELWTPDGEKRVVRRPDFRHMASPKPSAAPLTANEVDFDDLNIHRSWRSFDVENPGKVRYLNYEMSQRDVGQEEHDYFFKAVRMLRVTRVPRYLRQAGSGAPMIFDQQRDVLAALRESGALFLNVIANCGGETPMLFIYGTQGTGVTQEEAQQHADDAFAVLCGQLDGVFQQLEYESIDMAHAEQLVRFQAEWDHIAMGKGRPMPTGGSLGASSMLDGNRSDVESSLNQLEGFLRGMADRRFIMSLVTSPLSPADMTLAWRNISQHLSDVRSEQQGSRSFTAGVALPLSMGQSLGDTAGTSHSTGSAAGVSESSGVSTTLTDAVSASETVGVSSSTTQGASASETVGVSSSTTQGLFNSATDGISASTTDGTSSSATDGISASTTDGSSASATDGISASTTDGTSSSTGTTESSSATQGTSVTSTEGTSLANSESLTNTASATATTSETLGVSSALGSSTSESSTAGNSVGESYSFGESTGTSSTTATGSSQTETAGASTTTGQSLSETLSETLGVSQSASEGMSSSTSDTNSAGQSWNSSAGASSTGTVTSSNGMTNTGSEAWGQTTNLSTNQNHGLSESTSESTTLSGSNTVGGGQFITAGSGTTYSESNGTTDGSNESWTSSMGLAGSNTATSSTGVTESLSQAMSNGATQTDSLGGTLSQGQTVASGSTLSTSSGTTTSTGQGITAGQTVANGSSASISEGTSVTSSSGTTASSSLGHSTNAAASSSATTGTGTSATSASSTANTTGTSVGESVATGQGIVRGTSNAVAAAASQSATLGAAQSATLGAAHSTTAGVSQAATAGTSQAATAGASQSATAGTSQSATQGVSQSTTSGSSHGSSQGTSQSATTGTSQSATQGNSRAATQGSSQAVAQGTNRGTSSTQSLNDAYAVAMSRSQASIATLGAVPSVGVSVSRATFDEAKRTVGDMLEAQQKRYIEGIESGAMIYQLSIVCPDRQTLLAARGLAKSSFWGPGDKDSRLPQPFDTHIDFEADEKARLLNHARAFTFDRRREHTSELVEPFRWSSFVTVHEAAAFCHPPTAESLGILAVHDSMPVFAMPADRQQRQIRFGRLVNGERAKVSETAFGVDTADLEGHLLLAGTTGSGKSNSLMRVLTDIARLERNVQPKPTAENPNPEPKVLRAGVLALDWMENMRDLASVVPEDRFRFFSVSKPELGNLAFNPLAIPDPESMKAADWLGDASDNMAVSFGLGEFGRSLIAELLTKLFTANRLEDFELRKAVRDQDGVILQDAQILPAVDPATLPTGAVAVDADGNAFANCFTCAELTRLVGMSHLASLVLNLIDELATPEGGRTYGTSMRDRAQSLWRRLSYFAPGHAFADNGVISHDDRLDERRCNVVTDLVDPEQGLVTVIESDGLDLANRRFILGSLLLAVWRFGQSKGAGYFDANGDGPGLYVALEEAHEILGDAEGDEDKHTAATRTQLYESMFRRARALGMRLVAVVQNCGSVPEAITSNTSTVILHRQYADSDRKRAFSLLNWANSALLRNAEWQWLGMQPTGHAVVRLTPRDSYLEAAPVHVKFDLANLRKVSNDELRDLQERNEGRI